MQCTLCRSRAPDTMINVGWVPHFYIGDTEQVGPVCPRCSDQHLKLDSNGEFESKHPVILAIFNCCYLTRRSADWDEGAGGALYCPHCGTQIAQCRQL